MGEAIRLEVGGSLSYSGALAVLQDAATGGMTADKLSQDRRRQRSGDDRRPGLDHRH